MLQSISDYCKTIEGDTVYWCMGNEPVMQLVLNWTESCKRLNIPMLYVALDLQTYHIVSSLKIPTVFVPQGEHHVFVYKFIIGQQIMNAGKNWFYTDVDCVARVDYTAEVSALFDAGADMICQSVKQYAWLGEPIDAHGEYNCGTGMFGMRATQRNQELCETDYLYKHGYAAAGTCQAFANTHLKHTDSITLLDPVRYPTGHNFDIDADWNIFHVTGKYAYEDWDNTKQYLGDVAKISSLKQLGYWYI